MCANCAAMQAENEALMERYQIVESGRYAAERQVAALKRELHGSTSPESKKVQAVCDYHDELWRQTFPKARGLTYPMEGVNAKAVRRAIRWGKDVPEIKRVLDGAFASDFHRSKTTYLTLESILRDENRIRAHLERSDEVALEALRQEREDRTDRLWPPVDRVLLELRRLGLEPQKAAGKLLDPRCVWLHVAECPLCRKVLRVGETFETGFAVVECAAGCDVFRVLDALRLWPADLACASDPGVEWVPLMAAPAPVSLRVLPAPGSPVLFEMAA